MKAVTYTPHHGFALVEAETPQLGPDEVLLQVEACGVCGSDRQVVAGESVPTGTAFPLVMGHEIAGRIAALGETVTDWHVGDSVIVLHLWRVVRVRRVCMVNRTFVSGRCALAISALAASPSRWRYLQGSWCAVRQS